MGVLLLVGGLAAWWLIRGDPRGAAGTTVTLTLRRDGHDVQLVIERRKRWT